MTGPTLAPTSAIGLLLTRLDRPLTLVDVGARWGAPKHWAALAGHANAICFEPDEEEAARLNAEAPAGITYVPMALGAPGVSTATLHVTQQPACSSVYPPLRRLYEDYPALSEVRPERAVKVALQTLDTVLQDRGIAQVDLMKLDTQGSELDILRGAGRSLRTCALIDIEVEFNPIYAGQPLFCDVDRFMRDHGFVLWRLSEICHYATSEDVAPKASIMLAFSPPQVINHHPVPGGQVFWAQAQYVRAEYPRTAGAMLNPVAAIRAATVVAASGFWDLALEILSRGERELAEKVRAVLAAAEA